MNDICPVYKSWGKHPEHHDRLHARISSLKAENERLERDCRLNRAEIRQAQLHARGYEGVDIVPSDVRVGVSASARARAHTRKPPRRRGEFEFGIGVPYDEEDR